MNVRLDSKDFGLASRTVIEKLDGDIIALIIDRKSRIIMADVKKSLEKLRKTKDAQPQVKVALKTTASICGKTKTFLENEEIHVMTK